MKRKILYIITIPDWGGAQKYVFDSANSQKNDCEVVVSAGKSERPSKINLFEKCKEANVATHQFKYLVRQINLLKDILAIFEIRNYLEGEGPDIVHSNSSKAGIIVSFAVASLKHKPKVVHAVHGWVFLEPMSAVKKWFYIFLERLASRWRDEIIVLGEKERQIAINYKICPQEKLRITKHAISEIKFLDGMDARNQLNLPQDKKIIGTIANFYPSKGLEYLIGAASKIDRPDTIFVVIGDGPKRSNY